MISILLRKTGNEPRVCSWSLGVQNMKQWEGAEGREMEDFSATPELSLNSACTNSLQASILKLYHIRHSQQWVVDVDENQKQLLW